MSRVISHAGARKGLDQRPLLPFGLEIPAGAAPEALQPARTGHLKQLVRAHGLVVVRGVGQQLSDARGLQEWASRWGPLKAWPFGHVLELRQSAEADDTVFSRTSMPFHWDGMYTTSIPEFAMLLCIHGSRPGEGGRTLFTDTRRVLSGLGKVRIAHWQRLHLEYFKEQRVHYGGHAVSALIAVDPRTGGPILRYEGPHPHDSAGINPTQVRWHGVTPAQQAVCEQELADALHAEAYCYRHCWQPGDLVIADNYSLLHGREALQAQSFRHLLRVQVELPSSAPHARSPQRG